MEKKIFIGFLKDKGQRFTKERAAILQKTLSYHGHFDPESLYLKIRETGLKASRASVYRTLNLLCECGLIDKVRKTEHGTIYEYTFGHKHHDHMLCIMCGNTIEFCSEDLERLHEGLCTKQNFRGVNHTFEIRGYCKKCQKKRR
ncbi:MAG: transcriptional repressor [Nitrospirae bacterium CG_4_10_14_0_8_um_filter_41_23]|nr:transcriptional repressor [Nitrospirota bacterium]PIQ93106.1 MAG: transcriptional repressor [Nitrospirae bacterium CG11_big_fil_rev_8_21_14_0_20_41_14]PIV42007.1 MAG: transcriptional repressor [Nitrospirae bacterium CG02_land_8_20_14_3_00_41_53]PIW86868.1 MAG: transcriptional repressor [Nitrospirae bacterium CG_4_8_14_3_um_filter_41_47]PIY87408.1 MAG: transcriptional repressor [Nitrospirae bacterium CG_4_10_14_0_8_um_filter_41_23]PJA80417.1 MAG: transcriptional repressor [Nitrospirae bacter